ncbi:MAG: hypothetical protein ABI883_07175 [Chthoniobacterales bacterium]
MSDEKEDGERHKKVTAAITDEPQEEFISPVNRPSVSETEPEKPEPDHPTQRKSTAQ